MVAINARVIYRFVVRVSYPEKVISLTFQTNINLHMFRDEFVVSEKRGFFEEQAGFFSSENL